MPEVSRFFGISIRMYFDDHQPPHFHAVYGGAEIEVGIDPFRRFAAGFRAAPLQWSWNGLSTINGNCWKIGT